MTLEATGITLGLQSMCASNMFKIYPDDDWISAKV